MQVHGIHHVTAVTGQVKRNKDFYTQLLGLRLVKKSVNQDDVSAYHMFYADKLGSPGTDMTFFDWPQTGRDQRGTDSIANTLFRVNGRAALDYWRGRFDEYAVRHGDVEAFAGHAVVRFEDPEGQRLTLVDDEGAPFHGEVWDGAGIPVQYALRGFHGVTLSVPSHEQYARIFTELMGWTAQGSHPSLDNPNETVTLYAMDGGGPGKEVWVHEQPNGGPAYLGAGGVHHVAYRLSGDPEQQDWLQRLARYGVRNSGVVNRYYFRSVYFRISAGILFELATDDPGFGVDEPLEALGERLALPPFLEPQRAEIEAGLLPV
jgi:glyoxalase family protein